MRVSRLSGNQSFLLSNSNHYSMFSGIATNKVDTTVVIEWKLNQADFQGD